MNQINRSNIRPFIAQLYKERKGGEAPPALLEGWQHLSDEEINKNLVGLFESWGMGEQERQVAIERFIANQNEKLNAATSAVKQQVENSSHLQNHPPKRTNFGLYAILIVIFSISAFFGYQYMKYLGLKRVFAITENIAIRDSNGKSVGRMDLFQKEGNSINSYSSLRAMDGQVYYRQPEGSDKEYPSRMVMMDTIGFLDFVFKKEKIAHYVNINYIVNDKDEYELYQSAFKEVAEVVSDNAKLTVVHRKIIVGSMAKTKGTQQKYVLTNKANLPSNTLKNTESILVFEKKRGESFVIIASLNDGIYYQFEGNVNSNEYEPLKIVQIYDENNVASNLVGKYRFNRLGDKWRLYNVEERNSMNYELQIRNDGANYDFVSVIQEPIKLPDYDTILKDVDPTGVEQVAD